MDRFRLDDYSDRELVHIVNDLGDEEGWVTSRDIAQRVGLDEQHEHHVGIRLGWMRRYGIVEKSPKGKTRWRLTEAGRDMVNAQALSRQALYVIQGLGDAQIVWASHTLAGRFQTAAAPHATMTRREWQREIRRRGR